jgi:hypothetical protein
MAMSQGAYAANTIRSDTLQLFSNDAAALDRAWADMTASTTSQASRQATSLNVSQQSNGTHPSEEQPSRLDQSQRSTTTKSNRSNHQSSGLDQSQTSAKSQSVSGNQLRNQSHPSVEQSPHTAHNPSDNSQSSSDESKPSSGNSGMPGEAQLSATSIIATEPVPDEANEGNDVSDSSDPSEAIDDGEADRAWLQYHRWDEEGLTTIVEVDELAAQSPQSSTQSASPISTAGPATITVASSGSSSVASSSSGSSTLRPHSTVPQ